MEYGFHHYSRGRCILLYRSDIPLCLDDYSRGNTTVVPKKERDRSKDTRVRPEHVGSWWLQLFVARWMRGMR